MSIDVLNNVIDVVSDTFKSFFTVEDDSVIDPDELDRILSKKHYEEENHTTKLTSITE